MLQGFLKKFSNFAFNNLHKEDKNYSNRNKCPRFAGWIKDIIEKCEESHL